MAGDLAPHLQDKHPEMGAAPETVGAPETGIAPQSGELREAKVPDLGPAEPAAAGRHLLWRDRADLARAARAWEQAIPLYTLAVSEWEVSHSPGSDSSEVRYEALNGRAECYRHVGDFAAEAADLALMADMDAAAGATQRQIDVLVRRVFSMRWGGDFGEGRRLAEEAIKLARATNDAVREAHALLALARMLAAMAENAAALENVDHALRLSRAASDVAGEARGLWLLGIVFLNLGRPVEAQTAVEAGLPLYRRLGDLEGEANCMNVLAGAVNDMAQQRTYHYRSLALYEELGYRPGQALAATDLNVLYYHLGLYRRAHDYGEQSLAIAQASGLRGMLPFSLENLGMACAELGQPDRARQLFEEAARVARENGDQFVESGCALDLASLALATGRAAEARERLVAVVDRFRELGMPLLVAALARLGAAQLALDNREAALRATGEAVALLEAGQRSVDFLPQEVYWWRYRALGDTEKAWHALERAREEMIAGIATLSDEGLRRNYLNKMALNRDIIDEWLAQARRGGLSPEPLLAGVKDPGQGARWEQFSRLVDIGLRLNAQRDPAGLPRFIMDEMVELSGAERTALVLLDDEGKRYVATQSWASDRGISLAEIAPLLDLAERRRAAVLSYEPGAGAAESAEIDQLSVLAVPLIASGDLAGFIYADLPARFGRFADQDRDLLAMLANQSAVALQNANWAARLERRVEKRTGQLTAAKLALEQRANELAIINSVGEGLACQLDALAIIELVGEKARELVGGDNCFVALYDANTNTVTWPYFFLLGTRINVQPAPLGSGLTSAVIQARRPIIAATLDEQKALGAKVIEDGTPRQQSWIGVPIMTGDDVYGMVGLQDYQAGRYNENHVRLLATIAANASVALANARLFAETQRRIGELAMLSDIGKALASSLDMEALPQTIYEQVRRVMYAENMVLGLYDPAADEVEFVYSHNPDEVAKGTRRSAQIGLTGRIIRCRQSILLRGDMSAAAREMGVEVIGPPAAAWLGVPMMLGEGVLGVLIVQDYHDADAYDDSGRTLLEAVAGQAAIAVENARLFAEAERQRRLSESVMHRLADIINFLPDATLVIDAGGKIIAWNRALEEMTDARAEEMLGEGNYAYALPFYGERRPILIDLVFRTPEEIQHRYAHLRWEGQALVGESRVPGLRGKERYLLGTASMLRDVQGQPAGAIEIIRDITERKQMEDELRRAKAEAEAATQAKSAFLAMMSHEIRTPMNAIIGMSGLLMDTPLNDEQQEFAETIRTSGDALLTIINDILDFSKIEAGRMELEEQPFDLRECVESSLDLLRIKAAEKRLELVYQMADDLPHMIMGDVTRLRQILVNLLSNAVKFTEQGEVVLTVEPGSQIAAPQLHFAVRDTGIGIPRDRLDRLFLAFSQVDASTSRRYGGTGLGLAVSKRLAEMMGGRMWVESPAPLRGEGIGGGPGSAFHFTICARPAVGATSGVTARRNLAAEEPHLRGKRLLIVDDNATNRHILALQTRTWGLLLRDTASPLTALEWLRRGEQFDVAILDMHMPEMDGLQLAAEIRAIERQAAGDATPLPLVLLSSLGGREPGFDVALFAASLTKPIRPSSLFDALIGVIQAGPRTRPQRGERSMPAKPHVHAGMAADHPLRILMAEDNAVNQKLALRLLSQMGYRADVASNGLEAIQAVERQTYDVILMDVQMPEMDGFEATRRICARWPAGERPRIIAMTANAMQGDRELCLEAGMDDYLSKPIRVEELVAALTACQARI